MKKNLSKEDAIKRFQECHFGASPSDRGYNYIDQYKDMYVYGKSEDAIRSYLKLEKIGKYFRLTSLIFLFLFLLIALWVIIRMSLVSVICLWICACCGFSGISYILKNTEKYMNEFTNKVITIKKTEIYGT